MATTVLVRDKLPRLNLQGKYHDLTTSPATALLSTESLESLDNDSRETIEQAVDHAVFKTALFALDLQFRRKDGVLSLILPPLLQGKESAVRYLDAVVTLCVNSWAKYWQMDLSRATGGMRLVKLLFPTLKLRPHCSHHRTFVLKGVLPAGILAVSNFEASTHPTTVRRELLALLETFAKERPGARLSVRMRYHTGGVFCSK